MVTSKPPVKRTAPAPAPKAEPEAAHKPKEKFTPAVRAARLNGTVQSGVL